MLNKMLNNKILIIDDEPVVIDSIQKDLRKEGYEIFTAMNGKEGLAIFEKEHPVLIILDLRMPIMDGIEFLEHIKLRPSDPYSAIVLTGYGDDENIKRCFDLGISSFLRKPYNPYALMGIARNSIKLKYAQSKAEYLASFPQMNVKPVLEIDSSRAITYYNNAAANVLKMLGVNQGLSVFFPDDIDEILKTFGQKNVVDILYREVEVEGRVFAENIHIVLEFNVARIYATDITEHKLAEERIHKLFTAVEQSSGIVMITDTSGNIEYVNPKFTSITGYTIEDVFGKNPRILKSNNVFPEVYKQLWSSITSGNEWQGELHNRKKNGELYWEYASISPVRNMKGIIVNFIKNAEDITYRKLIEDELMKSQCELEERVAERTSELEAVQEQLIYSEKLSAIGKLSASIAHEFNNPIFGIQNVLELIRKRVPLDGENKDFIDMAIRECHRIADLIKKLLDFYRPSSDIVSSVDIHEIIDEILILVKNRLEIRKIELKKDYADEPTKVDCVPDQIKQVILNLVTNAEQAIARDDGEIVIRTEALKGKVKIHVQDNGCGIKQEDINHIFEPFFTTKAVKGMGLGLSVSYGIIKHHGGAIEVESLHGAGTTFTIILPVKWGGGMESTFRKRIFAA